MLCVATCLAATTARAATEIDLFFPVPVQGKLATEMQRLDRGRSTRTTPTSTSPPVYTGSYDDTNLKTHAAIQAGKPPAAVIMSANFVREYVINDEIVQLDPLIAKDGRPGTAFMDQFWPALQLNATEQGHVYGVPFQNSTPLLYYSVDAFKDAGLDPEKPPGHLAGLAGCREKTGQTRRRRHHALGPDDARHLRLSAAGSPRASRCPTAASTTTRTTAARSTTPSPPPSARCRFLDALVHKAKVMPEGVTDANAVTTAFFQGRTGMMILSTGSLSFVRDNMKTPYRTAFLPRELVNAAPIGGAWLILPKGNTPDREAAAWTLIKWLTSPEIAGGWSRFTGYFAPRIAAYDLPEMKTFIAEHPDAKVALDQIVYARGWFSTYNVVGVRKALEDGVQAVLSGKATPEAAMAKAQQEADALIRPYVEQTALKLPE